MAEEPDYVRDPVDDLDHLKAWRRGWGSGRRRRRAGRRRLVLLAAGLVAVVAAAVALSLAGCGGASSAEGPGRRGMSVVSGEGGATEVPSEFDGYYGRSHAVVIGIDSYETLNELHAARADAIAMAEALEARGFEVTVLLDEEATRVAIVTELGQRLADRVGPNDRVLVYFAGHGVSERSGTEALGYLMPVEGDRSRVIATGIPMNEVQRYLGRYDAKHVMFVADACYSGLALSTRSVPMSPEASAYLDTITSERVRFTLVGGSHDEEAQEVDGHGVFTRFLLDGISGEADFNRDGLVTSDELGAFVKPAVSGFVSTRLGSRQTPQTARSGIGEFVFRSGRAMMAAAAERRQEGMDEPCGDGRVRTPASRGHCCWPGQAYDTDRSSCVGTPDCPPGLQRDGASCLAASEGEVIVDAGEVVLRQRAMRPDAFYIINRKAIGIEPSAVTASVRPEWERYRRQRETVTSLARERSDRMRALDEAYEEATGPQRMAEIDGQRNAYRRRMEDRIERAETELRQAHQTALRVLRQMVESSGRRASGADYLALAVLEYEDSATRFLDATDRHQRALDEGTDVGGHPEPDFAPTVQVLRRGLETTAFEGEQVREASYLLGYALHEMGDLEGAAQAWRRGLRSSGDAHEQEMHLRLGELTFDDRRFAQAAPHYEAALAVEGDLWSLAAYKLAWSHWLTGDHDGVRRTAATYLRRAGSTDFARDQLAPELAYLVGRSLEQDGDYRGTSLADAPASLRARTLAALAQHLANTGRVLRARTALEAAQAVPGATDTLLAEARTRLENATNTLRARVRSIFLAAAHECADRLPSGSRVPATFRAEGTGSVSVDFEGAGTCRVVWDRDEAVRASAVIVTE